MVRKPDATWKDFQILKKPFFQNKLVCTWGQEGSTKILSLMLLAVFCLHTQSNYLRLEQAFLLNLSLMLKVLVL